MLLDVQSAVRSRESNFPWLWLHRLSKDVLPEVFGGEQPTSMTELFHSLHCVYSISGNARWTRLAVKLLKLGLKGLARVIYHPLAVHLILTALILQQEALLAHIKEMFWKPLKLPLKGYKRSPENKEWGQYGKRKLHWFRQYIRDNDVNILKDVICPFE